MTENNPIRVLVIEDEEHIRRFIVSILDAVGYKVFVAENGQRGLIEAGTRKPDVIILDLGLPDIDGLEVIKDIRGWSNIPILVLSARVAESEKVNALDLGADDYLSKPFGSAELTARIRAQLRRRASTGSSENSIAEFGEVKVDLSKRQVFRNNQLIKLTPIEYKLLALLIKEAGCVVTQRQILKDVWGPSYAESAHYLRIFMSNLRHKLEVDPSQPRHLITEIGVGYRLLLDN
jgi:two-component system, OmpR family, KDP operon response regulator KdpE